MKFGRLLVVLTVAGHSLVADGQPARAPGPRASQIAPPEVRSNTVPAPDTQRQIDLSLKNSVLNTNFAIATVSAGKERPAEIAVVVKPVIPSPPDDPARLSKHSRPGEVQRYMETHAEEIRARMAQETVDWSTAHWVSFATNIAVNFGPGEGKRVLWWAARWRDGTQITRSARIRVDITPPVIVITSPTVRVTSRPMIQLQGYSSEQLLGIQYDLISASKRITNAQGWVTRQVDDPQNFDHVTSYFTCFDIPLGLGDNEVVLRCKDLAGNVSTNRYTYVLKLDDDKTPPVISLSWPQNGGRIVGTNFTAQGSLDDYTARIRVVASSGDGEKTVGGMVERNGHFWLDNIPLNPGANHLAITASDAAGNSSYTNIVVYQSAGILMMNPVPGEQLLRSEVKVTGKVSPVNQAVWVNSVRAVVKPDGTWTADKVPVQPPNSGTAVFDLSASPISASPGSGVETAAAKPNRLLSAEAVLGTNVIVLNAQRPACGVFSLHLTGPDGAKFVLEASTNMVNWVPVLTNSLNRGSFDYADPDTADYQCRFFRVVPLR